MTTAKTWLASATPAAASFARAKARWALFAPLVAALALGGVVWYRRRHRPR
jgi:hypothetical protein